MLAFELINLIESLHVNKIILRVLSPKIVSIGLQNQPEAISINQFNHMKFYEDSLSKEHIKHKQKKNLFSNEVEYKYLSENLLNFYESSRRDDIESLGYFLLFLWKNIEFEKKEDVILFKNDIWQNLKKLKTPRFFKRNY